VGPPSPENELVSSSDEGMSVEVISPPRRPVTRSVSAKRAANEMDPEDNDTPLVSLPSRARKVRRVTGASDFSGKIPLLALSQSPEPTRMGGTSDATDASSYLDKDYFESENPWEEKIAYF